MWTKELECYIPESFKSPFTWFGFLCHFFQGVHSPINIWSSIDQFSGLHIRSECSKFIKTTVSLACIGVKAIIQRLNKFENTSLKLMVFWYSSWFNLGPMIITISVHSGKFQPLGSKQDHYCFLNVFFIPWHIWSH